MADRCGSRFCRVLSLLAAVSLTTACADGTPLTGDDAGAGLDIPPPPLPDKPGAPPPGAPDPDRPEPPDTPDPEAPENPGDGQPEDNCMGVDFLGVCHGTLAVWCDEGALYAYDCADDGLLCDYVDQDIGYYCVPDRGAPPAPGPDPEPSPEPEPEIPPEEPPPPDLPPEGDPPAQPDDPCPGVDWFGRCDGNVAVWCDDEEEILQFDCGWIGMVCRDLGFFGHRCVAPEQAQSPGG